MGSKVQRHDLDMQSLVRLLNLPVGTDPGHAINKAQLDNALLGLGTPMAVKVRSATNVDISQLNNGDSVGGTTVATGDLVFLDNQTTAPEDGAYVVGATAGTTVRSTDLGVGHDARGLLVVVESGTYAGSLFLQTANPAIIGTDGLTLSGPIQAGIIYTAEGTAVTLVGTEFRLQLDGGTLAKSVSGVKVSTDGITTTELANNAVATANIADDAVTEDKIDTGTVGRWKTITGPASAGATFTGTNVLGKSTIFATVQENTTGSTWRDVTDGVIWETDGTNITIDLGASVADRSKFRIIYGG